MASTLSDNQFVELDPIPFIYRFWWMQLLQVGLIGVAVGLITPIIAVPIGQFIIDPLLCRDADAFAFCAQGGSVAFGVALVLTSVAALLALATLATYQPLINVLAPLAMLWGLDVHLQTLATDHRLEFYLFSGLLFGLAYAAFYLLLRFRNFAVSLLLVMLLIIVVRWQL